NQADDKHGLPTVERDQEVTCHACEHQTDRKDDLVEQKETSALLGTDKLIDVGACHRPLTTRTDALKKAEGHHGRAAPGEQASDVHRGEQHDRDEERLQATDLLGERSEDNCSEKL